MLSEIKVLDKGYVRLVDCMGTDLTVVNAARVSFDKESQKLDRKDQRLIQFLAGRDETSPFRHAVLQLEIRAPLMVARQLHTYTVACCQREDQYAFNETSRRYVPVVEAEVDFYVPDIWRSAPENKKQGSGEPLPSRDQPFWTDLYQTSVGESLSNYNLAIGSGMAPEQARLFLPAYALYVRWRLTISLAAVIHLLQERLPEDAQWETQEYARAIHQIVKERFPECVGAFIE